MEQLPGLTGASFISRSISASLETVKVDLCRRVKQGLSSYHCLSSAIPSGLVFAISGLPCAAGPTPHWRLVPFDNNIGQRNVAPVAGGGGITGLKASLKGRRFWANNPYDRTALIQLQAILPEFLRERGWGIGFSSAGGAKFTLGPPASREVVLSVSARPGLHAPKRAYAGSRRHDQGKKFA